AYSVNWSTDTGLSRLGAAIIGLGDGTSGDYSGTLKLTMLEFADSTTMTTAAVGGGGGSVSVNGSSVSSPNLQNSASVTFTVSGSNITLTAAGGGGKNVLPAASSFTWANQGSSTYSQNVANGPILLSIADSGSVNFRMMYIAAP